MLFTPHYAMKNTVTGAVIVKPCSYYSIFHEYIRTYYLSVLYVSTVFTLHRFLCCDLVILYEICG